ncbi:HNH endonuclease signature motif containing protein [Homoserinimonas sp. A447]
MTSPRRGGPRMVDVTAKAHDEAIEADPRSIEQLSFDGFMAVLRIGADTDAKTATRSVLGARRPAVRVLVTKDTLDAAGEPAEPSDDGTADSLGTGRTAGTGGAGRRGHGRIEGQTAPVSIETVERHLCESGMVPVTFDRDGQCIDLGREQRLYSALQRIGLAARDGGCRWPGCTSPASWAEAHHIHHWKRDHGTTDMADGTSSKYVLAYFSSEASLQGTAKSLSLHPAVRISALTCGPDICCSVESASLALPFRQIV